MILTLLQGGGSTFGVITSATIKAYPSAPFVTATVFMGTIPGNNAYWDVVTSILSQYPSLDDQGISCYSFIAPSFSSAEFNITSPINSYIGTFLLPALHPSNSSDSLKSAINEIVTGATAPYPFQFFTSVTTQTYPDFWAWYSVSNGPLGANHDQILGSRLLDGKALTGNLTALKETYQKITPKGSITSIYLVGGKNVMNAQPRGGSNAVNPAWRKAYVHSRRSHYTLTSINPSLIVVTVVGVGWAPFDTVGKAQQENLLTNTYVEAFRQLAPDMGAYINEVSLSNGARC